MNDMTIIQPRPVATNESAPTMILPQPFSSSTVDIKDRLCWVYRESKITKRKYFWPAIYYVNWTEACDELCKTASVDEKNKLCLLLCSRVTIVNTTVVAKLILNSGEMEFVELKVDDSSDTLFGQFFGGYFAQAVQAASDVTSFEQDEGWLEAFHLSLNQAMAISKGETTTTTTTSLQVLEEEPPRDMRMTTTTTAAAAETTTTTASAATTTDTAAAATADTTAATADTTADTTAAAATTTASTAATTTAAAAATTTTTTTTVTELATIPTEGTNVTSPDEEETPAEVSDPLPVTTNIGQETPTRGNNVSSRTANSSSSPSSFSSLEGRNLFASSQHADESVVHPTLSSPAPTGRTGKSPSREQETTVGLSDSSPEKTISSPASSQQDTPTKNKKVSRRLSERQQPPSSERRSLCFTSASEQEASESSPSSSPSPTNTTTTTPIPGVQLDETERRTPRSSDGNDVSHDVVVNDDNDDDDSDDYDDDYENFYTFKSLIKKLTGKMGWKYRGARRLSHQWVYLPPGTAGEDNGERMKDYLYEESEVVAYCKAHNYKRKYRKMMMSQSKKPFITPSPRKKQRRSS